MAHTTHQEDTAMADRHPFFSHGIQTSHHFHYATYEDVNALTEQLTMVDGLTLKSEDCPEGQYHRYTYTDGLEFPRVETIIYVHSWWNPEDGSVRKGDLPPAA